jgi:hypothetical protein
MVAEKKQDNGEQVVEYFHINDGLWCRLKKQAAD